MTTNNAKPLVSLVTLNFNQTDVTCEFLESTKHLKYLNFETIVVDNGSKVNPTAQIEAGNYPNVKVIVSPENLGFTGGNNLGMRHAKGDYLFIVNNDTEVTPDLLDRLLEPFFSNPEVGVTCPKIRYFHQPDTIQYAGFNPMNLFTGRQSAIGSKEVDNGQYNESRFTCCAHGAAMLVKREVIDKVGMFADKFFIYYEESDWSARIIKAGFKIMYVADALIYHKESITMGKESALKVYFHTRNRILYMRRNTSAGQLVAFTLFFTFLTFPKGVLKYTLKGQFQHLKSFLRGTFWNLTTSSYSPVS
ncbi:dTDP-Rha--alpha-D-GlcNAc-pyrophosphate polyprenol alpha-3-L-rhamnosyltransferase [Chitinophaga caeni]|uniref:dTDP-Rha--alpha-D-GlcNAc-pyrophosphate polyprenol alpha-3-L-rhamnosyltransferase n=1 Tax=Chitinophaga caeni TaxID=2029983 RepID=A0A291QWY7_9BACT|nr:glycosyltransferase family 2 protein [Chitinophaga caeni]ATL48447.1 dTDP-Rha--alpha-D-GlcNAc-pyrophosphate polyprenol alpha-3-L-rhamnosyltransferase [Chitinophaga caeni]